MDSAVDANSTADVVAVAKFKSTDVVAMSGFKAAAANVVVCSSKVAVDSVGRSKVAADRGAVRSKVVADSGAVVAVKSTEQWRDRKNRLADCAGTGILPMAWESGTYEWRRGYRFDLLLRMSLLILTHGKRDLLHGVFLSSTLQVRAPGSTGAQLLKHAMWSNRQQM
jgi:hypothetical protein